jgi:hypothetical protein
MGGWARTGCRGNADSNSCETADSTSSLELIAEIDRLAR